MDTKSKSLIRIAVNDKKLPTHTEILRFIKKNYFDQTKIITDRIEKFVTEANICDILDKYDEVLSEKRKIPIKKYLLSKIQIMDSIYKGKE